MLFCLAKDVQETTVIAISEAGRLAYWMPEVFVDLVALNTSYTAHNGANSNFISELEPDLLFVHMAGTADLNCSEEYCIISPKEFGEIISKKRRSATNIRVVQAPLAIYDFLLQNSNNYDILVVRYGDSYSPLYAVSRQGDLKFSTLMSAIDQSLTRQDQPLYIKAWNSPNFRK